MLVSAGGPRIPAPLNSQQAEGGASSCLPGRICRCWSG
ncbi:hypothetical protein B5C34_13385 [Pacificimonas flava]|uniref:Uncharacterized protein n=1 Tax=Pacificimonas flava TaxID=1234595 RepID=A0A219BAF7_9SPHN|nr:hypothetical protein B5C34_13385 [Pacificimonas flava]